MNSLEPLLGRLLVFIIYCSVILTTIKVTSHYKMQTAKKNAELFVSEAYESGINDTLYFSFMNSEAVLGYTVQFALEGKTRVMNNQEIVSYIKHGPLILAKDEFLTCRLTSKDGVIRIGGGI